ncbi:response regulator transcription factor [Enterococcus sp. HY326]|uniref:response regulator transcription factor n=1 Tax=Enterococcus sp. HY326 TaxID=2971265 RepID=UPI00223FAC0B|nr:response regulator transcription factor [Enterococcus sp. HY326]
MANILIVEDEQNINQLVSLSLETVGHHCLQAFNGMEALALLANQAFDLIILDIQLPDILGYELMPTLQRLKIPVIFLTARSEVADRVKGLNLGAEDYLIKPFAIDELLARVQVVLRRFQVTQEVFTLDNLKVLLTERKVFLNEEPLELPPQEFNLLAVFIQYKNMALSREQLLEQAWGLDYLGDIRTVDVHVQRLRKKLKLEDKLITVFKVGYRLEVN